MPNERRLKKEVEKKNAMALFHIQMALEKSFFPRIVDAEMTKGAWKTLKDAYHGNDQIPNVETTSSKKINRMPLIIHKEKSFVFIIEKTLFS